MGIPAALGAMGRTVMAGGQALAASRAGRAVGSAHRWMGPTGRGGRIAQDVINADWAMQAIERHTSQWYPKFVETITVRVWGDSSKDCKMKDLQRLALAIAFGKVTSVATIGPHFIRCSYAYHNRYVEVMLGYSYSGAAQQVGFAVTLSAAGVGRIVDGPDEKFTGGDWPTQLQTGFGLGSFLRAGGSPTLEEKDRVILTPDLAPNPGPPFDGYTRADDLVALVTAALHSPCCTPPVPEATGTYQAREQPRIDPGSVGQDGTFTPGQLQAPSS